MSKQWTVGDLLSTSSAYWRGCALQAGVRLEIFTVLNDTGHTASQLAGIIGADVRGTEYLLNALSAMGLLVKVDSHFENSAEASELLSKQSKKYMGHIILHHQHILDGWAQLDEAVKYLFATAPAM